MKNYIANESGGWMTSSAYVRNTLLRCIELGQAGVKGDEVALYEALRLLGQACHVSHPCALDREAKPSADREDIGGLHSSQ